MAQVQVMSPDEMLRRGLLLAGYDIQRQLRVKRAANVSRFKSVYGSWPIVYVHMLEDMQTTTISEAYVHPKELVLENFLMAVHFLYCYPTGNQQEKEFGICVKTARKWSWVFAQKIQALKKIKVRSAVSLRAFGSIF